MSACTGHVPAVTGERYGHCGVCHRDFMGLAAFDKHRRGKHGARYCVDPATDDERTATGRPIAEWWQDGKGRWHEGARGEFWGADGSVDEGGDCPDCGNYWCPPDCRPRSVSPYYAARSRERVENGDPEA